MAIKTCLLGQDTATILDNINSNFTEVSDAASSAQETANNAMPKAGGAFTGSITVQIPVNDMNPATKKYVDDLVAKAKFTYKVATNAATTPQGIEWYNGSTKITGTLVASKDTEGAFYLVPCKHTAAETQKGYDEYLTVTDGATYFWELLGNTQDVDLTNYINTLSGTSNGGVVTNITKSGNTLTVTYTTLTTSSPTASGNATAFIDTISQGANGKITATKKTIPNATTSANGLMSGADKTKLDGIDSSLIGVTADQIGKVKDVTVNGTSVLGENGVAAITVADLAAGYVTITTTDSAWTTQVINGTTYQAIRLQKTDTALGVFNADNQEMVIQKTYDDNYLYLCVSTAKVACTIRRLSGGAVGEGGGGSSEETIVLQFDSSDNSVTADQFTTLLQPRTIVQYTDNDTGYVYYLRFSKRVIGSTFRRCMYGCSSVMLPADTSIEFAYFNCEETLHPSTGSVLARSFQFGTKTVTVAS